MPADGIRNKTFCTAAAHPLVLQQLLSVGQELAFTLPVGIQSLSIRHVLHHERRLWAVHILRNYSLWPASQHDTGPGLSHISDFQRIYASDKSQQQSSGGPATRFCVTGFSCIMDTGPWTLCALPIGMPCVEHDPMITDVSLILRFIRPIS